MNKLIDNIKSAKQNLANTCSRILSCQKLFNQHYNLPGKMIGNDYHTTNNARHLYILSKLGKTQLPDLDKLYWSKSTLAGFRNNMLQKARIYDMMMGVHYYYDMYSEKAIKNLVDCGTGVTTRMGYYRGRRRHHITSGFFCDNKYCPNEQKLKYFQNYEKIKTITRVMFDKYNYMPLMLTLTIPDVRQTPGGVLKGYYTLERGWKRLSHYKAYNGDNRRDKSHKGIIKGWICKVEFTYTPQNYSNDGKTINLHMHVMVFVHKSYLEKYGRKYFIPRSQWLADWRRASQMGRKIGNKSGVYITQPYYKDHNGNKIKFTQCQTKDQKLKCLKQSSKEIAKYVSKSADFNKIPKLDENMSQARKDFDPQSHWDTYHKDMRNLEKDRYLEHEAEAGAFEFGKLPKFKANKLTIEAEYQESQGGCRASTYIWKKDILPYKPIMRGNARKKYMRKKLEKALTAPQIRSIKAFYAIVVGLHRKRMIKFGGLCQRFSKEYDAKDSKLRAKYDDDDNKQVTWSFKIKSVWKNQYKDYLDTYLPLTASDKKSLTKKGYIVSNPPKEIQRRIEVTLRSKPAKAGLAESA